MDQLDGSARRTSSLFLKLWPVCIFEELTFQFVHCRSFRVQRRPCFHILDIFWSKGQAKVEIIIAYLVVF